MSFEFAPDDGSLPKGWERRSYTVMWTRHIPSLPGYYGFRAGNEPVEVVELVILPDGKILFWDFGQEEPWTPEQMGEGYFSGPIHFPEFESPTDNEQAVGGFEH